MALVLKINGVTKGFAPGSLNIAETLGQRATCDFEVNDAAGTYSPVVGQSVTLEDGALLVFGGTINDVGTTKPYNPGAFRRIPIQCVDYNQIADRRSAGEYEWVNTRANDIVRSIVTNSLSGEGIDLTYVAAGGGPIIERFSLTYPTVAEALTALGELAKRKWRIDYSKFMRWIDPASVTPAWTLNDTSHNALMGSISSRTTREQYANRVLVRFGAYLKEGLNQAFTGDGSRTNFQVDSPIAAAPTVTVGGVSKTIGVQGVDSAKDVYWSDGARDLEFTVAPAAAAAIVVTYTGRITATVAKQNDTEISARAAIEGGTGVYTTIVETSTQYGAADAEQYAQSLVDQLSSMSTVLNWESDQMVPSVGDRVTVAIAGIASGTFLIRQVRSYDLGGLRIRRSIEAQAGPILKDVVDAFKELTGAGSGVAGAASPVGGSADAAAPPTAPTSVTLSVVTGPGTYAPTATWVMPPPTDSAVGIIREAAFFTLVGDTSPVRTQSLAECTLDIATLTATDGPFDAPPADIYLEEWVRTFNRDNVASAWTKSNRVLVSADANTIPQPSAGSCSVTPVAYRNGVDIAMGVQLSLAFTLPANADMMRFFFAETAAGGTQPALAVFKERVYSGVSPLLEWYPWSQTASRVWVMFVPANRDASVWPAPTAACVVKYADIPAWDASKHPTARSITTELIDPATGVDFLINGRLGARYRYQFTKPASDPNYHDTHVQAMWVNLDGSDAGLPWEDVLIQIESGTYYSDVWERPSRDQRRKFRMVPMDHRGTLNTGTDTLGATPYLYDPGVTPKGDGINAKYLKRSSLGPGLTLDPNGKLIATSRANVRNGDFEDDLGVDWEFYTNAGDGVTGAGSILAGAGAAGSKGAALPAHATYTLALDQYVTCSPSTWYRMGFLGKRTIDTSTVYYVAFFNSALVNLTAGPQYVMPISAVHQPYQVVIKSPPNATYAQLVPTFFGPGSTADVSNGRRVDIDSVTWAELPAPGRGQTYDSSGRFVSTDAGALLNGDFEYDFTDWNFITPGNFTIDTVGALSGKACKYTGNGGGGTIYQKFSAVAGSYVQVKFWGASNMGTAPWMDLLFERADGADVFGLGNVVAIANGGYAEYTYIAYIPAGMTKLNVRFTDYVTTAHGQNFWIDQVSADVVPAPGPDMEYVNGTFRIKSGALADLTKYNSSVRPIIMGAGAPGNTDSTGGVYPIGSIYVDTTTYKFYKRISGSWSGITATDIVAGRFVGCEMQLTKFGITTTIDNALDSTTNAYAGLKTAADATGEAAYVSYQGLFVDYPGNSVSYAFLQRAQMAMSWRCLNQYSVVQGYPRIVLDNNMAYGRALFYASGGGPAGRYDSQYLAAAISAVAVGGASDVNCYGKLDLLHGSVGGGVYVDGNRIIRERQAGVSNSASTFTTTVNGTWDGPTQSSLLSVCQNYHYLRLAVIDIISRLQTHGLIS